MMTRSVDNINPAPAEAADEILESVHVLTHLYRAQQYRVAREPHALTHMEGRVLSFVGRHAGATQSELVAHSARDKGQMARLISALRERGLLEVRVDAVDRRIQRLHLTAAGRGIYTAVQRQRSRVARLAVADLDAGERRALAGLLRRVRSNLDAAEQASD
jgi:DNA-binding MarR family transcriptional regulator